MVVGMKWSLFTYKSFVNGNVILYNTLNDSLVKLSESEYEEVSKEIRSNALNNDVSNTLQQLGFLIGIDIDEKSQYMGKLVADWKSDDRCCIHILPTTACNFNCKYCYQSGIDRSHYLYEKDVSSILRYFEGYISDSKIKSVCMVVHGGEPTLNWKFVEVFLPELAQLLDCKGIDMSTQIVSNGYLLTDEKANLLKEYGWNRAQITLDGPENIHNQRRHLANGQSTFKQIIENIHNILDKGYLDTVSIRVNYDKNNVESIHHFIDYLAETFDTTKIILSFGLVTTTVDETDASEYSRECAIPKEELVEPYLKLYSKAIEVGFLMPQIFVFDGMCTSKMKKSLILSSNGDIYKCLSMVGRDEMKMGNIFRTSIQIEDYFFTELYDICFEESCPWIPICHTGCRFDALLDNSNIVSLSCKRSVLEQINDGIFSFLY